MEQHEAWVDAKLGSLEEPGGWTPDIARGLGRLRERRNPPHTFAWAMAGTALVACCVFAFPVTRAFASRCVEACGELVRHASTPVSANRVIAPDFTLDDAEGKPVRLSDFRGRVVLLNFWATWCAPCKVEIPWFVEFENTYRDRGLVVLGVSLDEEGWSVVKPFISRHGISYRVMTAGEDVAKLFNGVESLPTTLIIDRQGRISSTHLGLAGRSTYETELRAALGE